MKLRARTWFCTTTKLRWESLTALVGLMDTVTNGNSSDDDSNLAKEKVEQHFSRGLQEGRSWTIPTSYSIASKFEWVSKYIWPALITMLPFIPVVNEINSQYKPAGFQKNHNKLANYLIYNE